MRIFKAFSSTALALSISFSPISPAQASTSPEVQRTVRISDDWGSQAIAFDLMSDSTVMIKQCFTSQDCKNGRWTPAPVLQGKTVSLAQLKEVLSQLNTGQVLADNGSEIAIRLLAVSSTALVTGLGLSQILPANMDVFMGAAAIAVGGTVFCISQIGELYLTVRPQAKCTKELKEALKSLEADPTRKEIRISIGDGYSFDKTVQRLLKFL